MLVSETIGGLPILSSVYDHGPLFAAISMIVADFGIICFLMWLEGIPPWERSHYKTFLWNDTIFIPLFMAMAVVMLQGAPKLSGFYTQSWWHWSLLALGFAISLWTERGALNNGQYTWSQELSPSKLWHTFIYGIVFYWLTSMLVPMMVVRSPLWAVGLALVGFGGFAYNCYRDAVLPFPKDAHLEGTWTYWDWHLRRY